MPKVTIYTTPTCGFCLVAKKFFNDHKINYQEIDVSQNQEKVQEMVEKSGQMGVPVIIIKKDATEEIIIGFDEKKLKKELGL